MYSDQKKIKMKSGYEKGNTMMEIKKHRKKEERNILCLILNQLCLKRCRISKQKCLEDNRRYITEAHEEACLEKKNGVIHAETIVEVSLSERSQREKN